MHLTNINMFEQNKTNRIKTTQYGFNKQTQRVKNL